MVDIHCHILPQVDDGSRSWEMTLHMCAMAQQDGIDHIVATPHANDEFFYDRDALSETLSDLQRQVDGELTFSLGCDFHFSYENITDALANPHRYTIGNTQYLLVELSDFAIPPSTSDSLVKLIGSGLTPIITHPERNPMLQRAPERVLDWVRYGCMVQVTANSLTGRWGRKAQKVAEWLMKNGAVHVLATDAHGLESRPPILSDGRKAAERIVGREAAEAMVEGNPRAIVEGRELHVFAN